MRDEYFRKLGAGLHRLCVLSPRQQTAAMRDFDPAYVSKGPRAPRQSLRTRLAQGERIFRNIDEAKECGQHHHLREYSEDEALARSKV